jgi:hypothetical protein
MAQLKKAKEVKNWPGSVAGVLASDNRHKRMFLAD